MNSEKNFVEKWLEDTDKMMEGQVKALVDNLKQTYGTYGEVKIALVHIRSSMRYDNLEHMLPLVEMASSILLDEQNAISTRGVTPEAEAQELVIKVDETKMPVFNFD